MKGKQSRGMEIEVDYIGSTDDLGVDGQSGDSARDQSSRIQSEGARDQAQRGQAHLGDGDRTRGELQGEEQSENVPTLSTEEQGTISYE